MGKLINTTTMTIDAVTDGGAWYVADGGHDAAALADFERSTAMPLPRWHS